MKKNALRNVLTYNRTMEIKLVGTKKVIVPQCAQCFLKINVCWTNGSYHGCPRITTYFEIKKNCSSNVVTGYMK